jgi:hypothetical protein
MSLLQVVIIALTIIGFILAGCLFVVGRDS